MTTPLLSIDNLSRSYQDRMLFQGLSLEIHSGDFVIIEGASGSGKTTLMKLLSGNLIAPHGNIFAGRGDLSRYSFFERQVYKQSLGLVFQHNTLLPTLSIRENVCYPLYLAGVSREECDEKYAAISPILGLDSMSGGTLEHLSGGELQKIAFARAMIKEPSIIIADEPTGNLDLTSTKRIAQLMIQASHQGKTLVLITHDTLLSNYIRKHCTSKTYRLGNHGLIQASPTASSYTRAPSAAQFQTTLAAR